MVKEFSISANGIKSESLILKLFVVSWHKDIELIPSSWKIFVNFSKINFHTKLFYNFYLVSLKPGVSIRVNPLNYLITTSSVIEEEFICAWK